MDIHSPKIEAFKYVIYRKAELFNRIEFNSIPVRESLQRDSIKSNRELFLQISQIHGLFENEKN